MTQNDQNPGNDQATPQSEAQAPEVIDGADDGANAAQAQVEETAATDADAAVALIAALQAEAAKYKEEYLRAHAEMENVRRRAEQEVARARKFAVQDFAKDIVSVADNLARALSAVPAEARENDQAVKNLMLGVEMTEREVHTVFERYKIAKIDSLNRPFDPNLHQAMMEIDDPSRPSGTIVQVLQDGYTLHERLLRPAMVAVSKGGPKPVQNGDNPADQSRVDQQV